MADTVLTDFGLFRRIMRYARPFLPHLAGIFLVSVAQVPISLLTPLPMKIVVDNALGGQPISARFQDTYSILFLAIVVFLAIALLNQLQGLGAWLLNTWVGERLVLEFRSTLFRHLQRLSLAFHDAKGTSDPIYSVLYDAYAIQAVAIKGIIPFVTSGLTLAGMFYITAVIDWQLAVIAVAVSPLLYWMTRVYKKRLREYWLEIKAIESSALSIVQEAMSAVRVVKAFGAEQREEKRFIEQSRKGARGQVKVAWMEGSFGLVVGMIIAVGTAAALYIGTLHVQTGVITLGSLLIVMAYLAQLYKPLEAIGKNIAQLQSSLAAAQRAFALLDEVPDVDERPGALPLQASSGRIVFENVSFNYVAGRKALDGISFAVDSGARIGIFGETGAGKSTLVSLLPRFYDPTAGRVLLDEVDLRDYRLADLRNQFAIVLQDAFLFSTSVLENIAYARPGATEEEIIAAAEAANAHEFISRLPDGYQSEVGERGVRLSGGERQRISLARAFLKDAPILILDEPTSSVDVQTEAAIMEAMERLMEGRTTFIIAHRLGTLRHCDLAFQIERGRLIDITYRDLQSQRLDLPERAGSISAGGT